MSQKYPLFTRGQLIELLCTAAQRPSHHCIYHNSLRTSRRCYASATPTPDKTSNPSTPSSSKPPLLPTAGGPGSHIPGSHIPMRMLLDRNPENRSAISRIPIPSGERGEKFVPQPLARPLGLPYPPEPGQNSPIDRRTVSEKRADFSNYEKALERRRMLF